MGKIQQTTNPPKRLKQKASRGKVKDAPKIMSISKSSKTIKVRTSKRVTPSPYSEAAHPEVRKRIRPMTAPLKYSYEQNSDIFRYEPLRSTPNRGPSDTPSKPAWK